MPSIHLIQTPSGVPDRLVEPSWDDLFPNSLAVTAIEPSALGLDELVEEASEFFDKAALLQSSIRFNAAPYYNQDSDLWSEVSQLLVGVGETSNLLVGALVEAEWSLRAAEKTADPVAVTVAASQAHYLAEAAMQSQVSVGHMLTNAAFRLIRSSPTALALATKNGNKTVRLALAEPVGSMSQKAWRMHSDIGYLVKSLGQSRAKPTAFARNVNRLYQHSNWIDLSGLRGSVFHRLRPVMALDPSDAIAIVRRETVVANRAARVLGRYLGRCRRSLQHASPTRGGISLVPDPITIDFDA